MISSAPHSEFIAARPPSDKITIKGADKPVAINIFAIAFEAARSFLASKNTRS
jgi:hypothetical protein